MKRILTFTAAMAFALSSTTGYATQNDAIAQILQKAREFMAAGALESACGEYHAVCKGIADKFLSAPQTPEANKLSKEAMDINSKITAIEGKSISDAEKAKELKPLEDKMESLLKQLDKLEEQNKALESKNQSLTDQAKKATGNAVDAVKDAGSAAATKAGEIKDATMDKMKDIKDGAAEKIGQAADKVKDAVK